MAVADAGHAAGSCFSRSEDTFVRSFIAVRNQRIEKKKIIPIYEIMNERSTHTHTHTIPFDDNTIVSPSLPPSRDFPFSFFCRFVTTANKSNSKLAIDRSDRIDRSLKPLSLTQSSRYCFFFLR